MKQISSTQKGICEKCGSEISIEGTPTLDQRVTCTQCGDVLKIVALDPIQLEWAWEDLLEGPEYSVRSWRERKMGIP
jgi:lysine biosynthesis protein LysW